MGIWNKTIRKGEQGPHLHTQDFFLSQPSLVGISFGLKFPLHASTASLHPHPFFPPRHCQTWKSPWGSFHSHIWPFQALSFCIPAGGSYSSSISLLWLDFSLSIFTGMPSDQPFSRRGRESEPEAPSITRLVPPAAPSSVASHSATEGEWKSTFSLACWFMLCICLVSHLVFFVLVKKGKIHKYNKKNKPLIMRDSKNCATVWGWKRPFCRNFYAKHIQHSLILRSVIIIIIIPSKPRLLWNLLPFPQLV